MGNKDSQHGKSDHNSNGGAGLDRRNTVMNNAKKVIKESFIQIDMPTNVYELSDGCIPLRGRI
jgi:hypothetical protein